ncbi:MAG: EVE domain-containing protein [Candidatus Pacebacteria bacterium]|jgi:predicted RNA-binding protein with PUA-like domain|nr:EVE domain-containing protein [Candidatus Paceibacterota bacterium]
MNYWLVKSEEQCYSIDDLKKEKRTAWEGVRNFQARNFMKDGMKVGDLVLFYHSMSDPTGVYGIAKVVSATHIDESALDPKDEHYDPKAVKYQKEGKDPLWVCVDLQFVSKFSKPVSLEEIKQNKQLQGMLVTKRGQRLSVMPVEKKHFEIIQKM